MAGTYSTQTEIQRLLAMIKRAPAIAVVPKAEPVVDIQLPSLLAVGQLVLRYFEEEVGVGSGYCGVCNELAPTIHGHIIGPVPHTPDCLYHLLVRAIAREKDGVR